RSRSRSWQWRGVAVPLDPVTIRPVATSASTLPPVHHRAKGPGPPWRQGGCPEPAMDGRRPELGAGCAYSGWASPLPPRRAAHTFPEQPPASSTQSEEEPKKNALPKQGVLFPMVSAYCLRAMEALPSPMILITVLAASMNMLRTCLIAVSWALSSLMLSAPGPALSSTLALATFASAMLSAILPSTRARVMSQRPRRREACLAAASRKVVALATKEWRSFAHM